MQKGSRDISGLPATAQWTQAGSQSDLRLWGRKSCRRVLPAQIPPD
jgi:hypothetical protein